ncbi:ATP-dependent DNA helicase [Actinomyces slackii]|uniref:DNA 3'-5' helicase n=1 Tax=Actinomyces slackii TaxID=52774 RepID=A0A3S4SPG9_9ACTO|nr:ATP-dependent DNA helicase [Actinomyces slackii]VEG74759.1 ATP-dependent DNA helicase pcrA [Actinomyces slackii]
MSAPTAPAPDPQHTGPGASARIIAGQAGRGPVASDGLTPVELARVLGLHAPTSEQARVIAHPLSPLLVVAGAGSGKTATMSQRVVHLVATGAVRPDQVLGLTFTRKATAELAQRVSTRLAQLAASGLTDLSPDAPEPTIATYNSFAGTIVREHGLRIGVDPEATLITEARAWQIASGLIEARTEPLPVDSLGQATQAVLRLDGALSENLLSVEDAAAGLSDLADLFESLASIRGCKSMVGKAPQTMSQWHGLLEAAVDYREHKRRHGLLDFGDQIALACRIAEGSQEVREHLRAQYPAVLLDEFQDTSVAQVRLLSALFAGSGVTAVGDPHQAIYGWRGASAGALDAFHARFNPGAGGPGAPVLPLSTAWRNDTAILQAANAVSAPLRNHQPEPGDAVVEHIPVEPLQPRPAQTGLARGLVAGAYLQDPLQEAETIAAFLAERWSPQAQMAVLCRARGLFEPIAAALERSGLPVSIVGLGGMLTVPEVADLRALITVAADPERGDRLMRLLTGAGIAPTDLAALHDIARGLSRSPGAGAAEADAPQLCEALEAIVRAEDARQAQAPAEPDQADQVGRSGWSNRHGSAAGEEPALSPMGRTIALRLGAVLRRVRAGLHLPLPELLGLAEQALGLDIDLAARTDQSMGRRALDAFHATAQQYADEIEAPTLAGFLRWLDTAQERENGMEAPEVEPEPGAVQLLTIHASKGLEWDTVAVAGMTEGVFPSYRPTPKPDLTVSTTGWMTSRDEFPHPLRADAQTLPPFELGELEPGSAGQDDKDTVKEMWGRYALALGRHGLAEERRLAYVAITRARHDVLLTGSHLAREASKAKPASRFLQELRRRDLVTPWGQGWVEHEEGALNPMTTQVRTGWWPEPLDSADAGAPAAEAERHALRRARDQAARAVAEAGRRAHEMVGPAPGAAGGDPVVQRWWTEAALLLAERQDQESQAPGVRIPTHLAATRLDDLRSDPAAFALDLRRPLPPEPRTAGRLGTVFHEAIAQRLAGRAALIPLSDAGVPDSLAPADRRRVEQWLTTAESLPLLEGHALHATEVERELTVGGTTLRCRIDAVFQAPGGGWLIVDWKTGRGRVPVDQLSVYVHAWAASQGVPTGQVRAAYAYVDRGEVEELAPADLLPLEAVAQLLAPGAADVPAQVVTGSSRD